MYYTYIHTYIHTNLIEEVLEGDWVHVTDVLGGLGEDPDEEEELPLRH